MVAENIIKAYAGQISDTTLRDVLSFSAEETIEFGRPLMRGTNKERQAKNFVADVGRTNKFLGVSVRILNRVTGNYPAKTTVDVLDKGRVWVPLTTGLTIVAGNVAFLNQDTNNITNVSTSDQIKIGRFQSSGTSNGLTGSALFELELIPGFQF